MAGSRPAAGSSMGFLSHDGQDKEARGKETDDRQADEPEVTFYTHGLCPYAQRVAITLEAKGVDYKSVHIDLSNKPSWYFSVNPRGLVPAADVSGQVVTESIDICRFLDERYPKVPLVPSEAQSSRAMDRLVSKADSIIHAGLAMVAGSERLWAIDTKRGSRGGGNARVQGEWIKALDSLQEAVRQSQGPFLTGADLSLADVVLFPFLARFQLVAEGIRGEPFSPDHPLVTQWMAAMWQQPSARRTFPDRDRFLLALKQYASLDYFDFHSTSLEDPVPKYWV
ncbi:unnamed protein product [Closterium sp. NIES-64]|nr:unnamed protein product [Closterium sp. NIES-64]CAI5961982.1 unnamed protein product [Closterium sp. NIES-65]